MAKIRFSKNELKKQKDDLKRYQRYLPALRLKKQQLQLEISKVHKKMEDLQIEIKRFRDSVYEWVDVFGEKIDINPVRSRTRTHPIRKDFSNGTSASATSNGVKRLISVEKINTHTGNIGGVDIPILDNIEFKEKEYDFITTPIWVDYGIIALKKMTSFRIEQEILEEQLKVIKEELRIITQRVNLFEEVKIPEAQGNIRRIQIYLGDSYTAAVVIGKIAKSKIERKAEALVV